MTQTAPALEKLDALRPLLEALPAGQTRDQILDETDALRLAIAAFHMEAIRFRMFAVDRLIRLSGDLPDPRRHFDELRLALEAAGFHTRSHTAP
jgi:hypothetical protein